jgi:predicted metal-dependent hydrolase
LQDHIIYHELAHLTHLDHSDRFYRLLQVYDPHSSENDHRVSKLSPQLMALGR